MNPQHLLIRSLTLSMLISGAVAARADAVDELIEASGLDAQISLMPEQLKVGLLEGLSQMPLPADAGERISASVDANLAADAILGSVRQKLEASLAPQEIEELLGWYQSPQGQAITAAEQRAAEPAAVEAVAAMYDSLLADTERRAIAAEINELTTGTDFALQLMAVTQRAVFSGFSGAMEPADQEALAARVQEIAEQMRPEIDTYMQATLVYVYRETPIRDLERYRDFLATPASRTFSKSMLGGIAAEWESSIGSIGSSIAAVVQELVLTQESASGS